MISKSPSAIIDDVCTALTLSREKVLSSCKDQDYCDARYIITHLLYNNCLNYREISQHLNKRRPAMAHKARKKFEWFNKTSPHFKDKFIKVMALINGEQKPTEAEQVIDKVCVALELNVCDITASRYQKKYYTARYIIAKILSDKKYITININCILKQKSDRNLVNRFNTLIQTSIPFQRDYNKVTQLLNS